ncbi:rod shape-determining protein RodA [Helicobacter sp. faydin-H17]|nr:FtsW/RodA/SpoVE family cell cycle protein [Helicobacter kayseriensis]MCE3047573.1 rod shape-determining protein RodA [Helicobacter kayseriensis]MCE3048944.1 rod shape-determining protein RodA [Helicobacter kayseriensis]
MFSNRRILAHFDFLIPLLILPIIGISMFLIYELGSNLIYKQLIYVGASLIIAYIIFFIPFRKLSKTIYGFYWLSMFLLILVEFVGTKKLGAQRWIEIPFTPFSIQPSEILKISLMLMLALVIRQNPPPKEGYDWHEFGRISLLILGPFLIILQQPDLGTALTILFMGYGMLFLIGVNKKIWITLFCIFAFSSPLIYEYGIRDYQKKRIHDFLSEKPSHQVTQSIIAIGAGGLRGKVKDEATQSQLKFLPIATSDFIFAYYMERFGFVGGILLIVLYLFLIFHILFYSLSDSRDYFLRVISSCVAILFFVYMSVNIAMTIGFAPVVGLPLPLFSYGGTSFLTFIIMLAILENLLAFRFDLKYNSPSAKGPLAQLVRALGS